MQTFTNQTATADAILAIDRGKYKNTDCVYRSADKHGSLSIPTSRDELTRLLATQRPAAHRPPAAARWIPNTNRRPHRVRHPLPWCYTTHSSRPAHRAKSGRYSANRRAWPGHGAIRGRVCFARAGTLPICWRSYRLRCVGLPSAAADALEIGTSLAA